MAKKASPNSDWITALVENSPNVVFAFNKKGEVVFVNKIAKTLFPSEFSDQDIGVLLGQDGRSSGIQLISDGGQASFTRVLNGNYFRFSLLPIVQSELCICYGTDISDLMHAQEALINNQLVLRRVIDTDPNLIFVKDREGRFLLVNQAVADIYGTTIESLIGKKDSDFNPNQSELEHFLQDDLEVIRTQQEKMILEEQVTNSQGISRWFSTVKRPLEFTSDGSVQVLGVSTDVTEVRALQNQLGHAQKMQALGQLAGGIAHDFNNLLTAILGHAEVLLTLRSSDAEVTKSANLIYGAGTRAQQLTGQLLGFARQGKNQHTTVYLRDLIEETVTLLRRTLDPTVTMMTRYAEKPLYILGDPTQIQQVLMNLILNARDAIMTRDARLGKGTILCEITEQDNTVVMQVSDDGCGMHEEIRSRIFEPFFTTKELGKGTGLGLAMVYGIVKNHNGDILIDSVPDVGTDIFVRFPKASIEEYQPASIVSTKPHKAQGKILLVDDNPDVRGAAERMLSALGYEVTTCASGEEAIALCQVDSVFDAALVDLMMPGIGGEETVQGLKSLGVGYPIIITTGYGKNNAIQKLVDGGATFLKKPYEMRELQSSLDEVIGLK